MGIRGWFVLKDMWVASVHRGDAVSVLVRMTLINHTLSAGLCGGLRPSAMDQTGLETQRQKNCIKHILYSALKLNIEW